jgi:hypothetical protein
VARLCSSRRSQQQLRLHSSRHNSTHNVLQDI